MSQMTADIFASGRAVIERDLNATPIATVTAERVAAAYTQIARKGPMVEDLTGSSPMVVVRVATSAR
jgi:hypothetical protein